MQWAEHHAVDAAWTEATIDDVTQGRIPAVPASPISHFWDRTEWLMPNIQGRGAPEFRTTLQRPKLREHSIAEEAGDRLRRIKNRWYCRAILKM
jgi:hypothetical protein